MRGIDLKMCVEQFGWKDGFSFWFRWGFINPVQMFVWLNITHKPYCTYCGYHCREGCDKPKLTKKSEIVALWKKFEEENKGEFGGYY